MEMFTMLFVIVVFVFLYWSCQGGAKLLDCKIVIEWNKKCSLTFFGVFNMSDLKSRVQGIMLFLQILWGQHPLTHLKYGPVLYRTGEFIDFIYLFT